MRAARCILLVCAREQVVRRRGPILLDNRRDGVCWSMPNPEAAPAKIYGWLCPQTHVRVSCRNTGSRGLAHEPFMSPIKYPERASLGQRTGALRQRPMSNGQDRSQSCRFAPMVCVEHPHSSKNQPCGQPFAAAPGPRRGLSAPNAHPQPPRTPTSEKGGAGTEIRP